MDGCTLHNSPLENEPLPTGTTVSRSCFDSLNNLLTRWAILPTQYNSPSRRDYQFWRQQRHHPLLVRPSLKFYATHQDSRRIDFHSSTISPMRLVGRSNESPMTAGSILRRRTIFTNQWDRSTFCSYPKLTSCFSKSKYCLLFLKPRTS